ncbi:MAG: PH domain-containing protein [Luteitalea sp.]|nr:PH domain-containing protein [Luteitalea sp.]
MDSFSERLDPQYVAKERVAAALVTGVLVLVWLLGLTIALVMGLSGARVAQLVGGALFVSTVGTALWTWPPWQWRHTSFTIDHDALWIRRGAIWKRAIVVPRSRIQHVDISQGPLERLYGLATLVVYTAGHSHARVPLPGLALPRARSIRDSLLGMASDTYQGPHVT